MSDNTNNDVSYVRTEFLEPSEPPMAVGGPVKWIKDNLFSSWFNSILTVIALYFIIRIAVGVYPWFANSVWGTDGLAACREILDGATGACFSILQERWNQMLFGFYPSEEYWRPIVGLILLAVAAAPVLFWTLPRQLLYFTGIYPFLAYWLVYGGSIWFPILLLVALCLSYLAYARFVKSSFVGAIAVFIIAFSVLMLNPLGGLLSLVSFVATQLSQLLGGGDVTVDLIIGDRRLSDLMPLFGYLQGWLDGSFLGLALPEVTTRDVGGFMLNMILGTICVSLSIPLGIVLALGRQSNLPVIKGFCVIFIEFIRGVPLITLLFVANVMLAYFFPAESNPDLILRVIIMITMFSAAYIAEVIRGGLAALPRGQYEAGDSLGLDYPQSMRLIILPQALKISIPGIVNVAVGLFKDTTLVSVISMFDLVGIIRGPILGSTQWTGIYWEVFGFAALLFFVVCYGISQYSQWLERQLATDHR
ncbi:MAG: amino acid ABC transporter permease [Rhodobacteraceae bacterium]|nr:amino acid ABC transporter permease [Paracoccaceae bacterium]